MSNLKLISPWYEYYAKVDALFKEDPEVKAVFDEEELVLKLYVDDASKAEAIAQLLPEQEEFGNVLMRIEVIPPSFSNDKLSLFKRAFHGNPAFIDVKTVQTPFAPDQHFVIFAKRVVQYFNDDIRDLDGIRSTLYQNLAEEVLRGEILGEVRFCTEYTPMDMMYEF